MIYIIYPCPVSFFPPDSFFPPGFILPPYHFALLEIVKWFTLYSHVPNHFSPWIHFAPIFCPPYYFAPWKSFNDLHYLPMSHIIFAPWIHFALISFCPHTILPPGNRFMIYTIYPCPILPMSNIIPPPLDSFCPRIILLPWKEIV